MTDTSSTHDPDESTGPSGMVDPRRLTVVVAVGVTVLGAAAVVGARPLGYWTPLGPGPGFFPTWLGVLLVACGAAWTVTSLRALRSDRTPTATEHDARDGARTEAEDAPPAYSLPTVVAILVSLCVLAAVLEPLGYQLSMFVFLMYHLMVLGRRRLLLSLVISLAGSVGVFWAFTSLLGVALPYSSIYALNVVGL